MNEDKLWAHLPTEAQHPESRELDTLGSQRIVELLLREDRRGLDRALACSEEIARAADWLAETLAGGGRAMLAGAGTSGRLGMVEAAECPPTFGTDPERVRAVIAGGSEAVFRAREGAEDSEEEGAAAVRDLGADDLLLGLSASSVTPFVLGALSAARRQGARTVLLTCAARETLQQVLAIRAPAAGELDPPRPGVADLEIALDTGPEILTGSTRLKAGSATKAALNAITTAAMVRLGKVYGNLMVDLRPGSAKLRDRSLRILTAGAKVQPPKAAELLERAGGELKTALVMELLGVEAEEARRRLRDAGGHVRQALGQRD